MDTRKQYKVRLTLYVLVATLLFGSSFLLKRVDWQGSVSFHTLLESLATLLGFFVGIMALIRYFSQRDSLFLYVGAGFLGTDLLDAYHTIVTSEFFLPYMPMEYPQMMTWSWIASRLYLSILMFASWLLWYLHRDDPGFTHQHTTVFWITGLTTASCFLGFFITSMPTFPMVGGWVPRPFDLIPGVFFLLALIGYLRKGAWKDDDFEHWLVLSLIVSLASQTIFMPFSSHLHDTEFNFAHLLKKLSYVMVLIGLLTSLYQTYLMLKNETTRRMEAEDSLRADAEALLQSERWFRAVADYTYDWETWISPAGELLYNSPSCERITGYPTSAFLSGKIKMQDIFHPFESISTIKHFTGINDNAAEEVDFRIITKAGEERWINHVCQPVFDESGHFIGRRASNRDITERKQVELESQVLMAALHNAPVAVLITDTQSYIEYVNPKFVEITGYGQAEVLGKNPKILKSGEHSTEFYEQLWDTLTSGATWIGEFRNKRHDNSLYWVSVAISPILDGDGNIRKYVAVEQEITERKKLDELLYRQANFDSLTGLPNRTLFNNRLDIALKNVLNEVCHSVLMMLDLDYFKEVNDKLGHDAGDELLKQVADRMLRCVRESDVICRIGGDEFIILLENYTEEHIPREIAQRLLNELAKPFVIFGQTCEISTSIGLAFFSPEVMDAEKLKKNADIALYQAKSNGRNCVVFFNEN